MTPCCPSCGREFPGITRMMGSSDYLEILCARCDAFLIVRLKVECPGTPPPESSLLRLLFGAHPPRSGP